MTFSKIPIPIKGKGKLTGYKQRLASKMEMDGEKMLLMAEIELLKKEKDVTLKDLRAAENTISVLKSEILVMKETVKDQGIKHQADISKLRASRNTSFNFARKNQIFTDRKLAETEKASEEKIASVKKTADAKLKEAEKKNKEALEEMRVWKDKFEELDNIVKEYNAEVNKEWPLLSDDDTTAMVSHISSKRDQIQSSWLQAGDDNERVTIEFCRGFSMVAILELSNDGVTEFKNDQIRRVPLEDEPMGKNEKP